MSEQASERASDEFSLRCLFSRPGYAGYPDTLLLSLLRGCRVGYERARTSASKDLRDRDGKKGSQDGLRVPG